MKVHRKQLASGFLARDFDVYANSDPSGTPSSGYAKATDDPGELNGANISNRRSLTTVNINQNTNADNETTTVVSGLFKPNETGTWDFRLRCDDAGYLWIGSNAEPLEWNLSLSNELIDNGGVHGATNGDGSISLTCGVLYPFKAMVSERGGGFVFIIDFKGPSEGALSNTARDGSGFFFHNPYAANGYNLDS